MAIDHLGESQKRPELTATQYSIIQLQTIVKKNKIESYGIILELKWYLTSKYYFLL